MKKSCLGKATSLLLALAVCLSTSCAAVLAEGEPTAETDVSTAKVSFTAPSEVFSVEGISPAELGGALNVDFTGELPVFLSDAYAYATTEDAKTDRWLKIIDKFPLKPWNVTASMGLFSEEGSAENTNVFGARLTMTKESVTAYRQMEQVAADDATGLSTGDDNWSVPQVVLGDAGFVLVSGGGATSLTTNAADTGLERGVFFIRFQADGIALDNLVPQSGKTIEADTTYMATITWTGTGTPEN